MLELRSFHNLRGRNSRNIAAQAANMVFTACMESEAIVNASGAAIVMSRTENDAFVNNAVIPLYKIAEW